jgi:hypothetical protein
MVTWRPVLARAAVLSRPPLGVAVLGPSSRGVAAGVACIVPSPARAAADGPA